ncbi:alpha/beta hydrolase, partial [Mycobacteroides abscessus subsp. abscessus]|uniref:alpha/beta hydrolase family protein n=1 Tax=Mycobacteroides abscessus TaxID=36809 RepID=UPI00266DA7BE
GKRNGGPPSAASADKDRAGIAEVINKARAMVDGPLLAGGHSYGGRQTSMLVAEKGPIVDVLTLFSYPLHPPGKPDRLRIEHLPDIQVPTVFTHGTSDAFGTIAELKEASVLIPGGASIVEIAGARHDLGSKTIDVPALAIDAALTALKR